jgi:predicted MFS family arabinose efflux permease
MHDLPAALAATWARYRHAEGHAASIKRYRARRGRRVRGKRGKGAAELVAREEWALILAGLFFMNSGWATYSALFTNFVSQDLHIHADQLGLVESLREIPGFLTVVLAAITVRMRESRVTSLALLILGIGLMGYSTASSLGTLIAITMFGSVGFHLFMPLSSGLVLGQAGEHNRGRRMGRSNTVGAIGTLVGTGLVLILVIPLGLRGSFVPAGGVVLLGALCLWLLHDQEAAPRVSIIFRRRYLTYYLLTMLDGSRRQIFGTFAVFLLVRNYHVSVQTITILLLVNTVVTMVFSMPIGRLIDVYGERAILVGNYLILVVLFSGYALVHTVVLLGILFCIDNMLFCCGVAITTYLGKIAPRSEMTPSLAMGGTANHIAAVGVPVVGGILWDQFGYQVTFFAGAATCIISILVSLSIHLPAKSKQDASA